MSLKKTLVKNSALNITSYIYLIIASFISIPLILNNLGKETYGVLILFASLVPIISSLDFGLGPAVIRKLSLPSVTKNSISKTWQTSFALFIYTGVFIWLVSILTLMFILRQMPSLSSINTHTYIVMSLTLSGILFVNHLSNHFLTLPQAKQRFDIYNIRTFLVGTGNTLGTAFLAYLTHAMAPILIFQLSVHLLNLFIISLWTKSQLTDKFWPRIHKQTAKGLIGFGVKNFIGKLANQIKAQFSSYALGGMLSATAVTAFSIPQSIIIKGAGGISQLTLSFFPMSASLITKDKLDKLLKLILSLEILIFLLGVLQVLAVYSFGDSFLLWWLKNPDIAQLSAPVLKILSWFFLLTTLTSIPSSVLDAINKPHIPSLFATLNMIISVSLMLVLTPIFGVLGPAYAILSSSIILAPSFLIVFSLVFKNFIKDKKQF